MKEEKNFKEKKLKGFKEAKSKMSLFGRGRGFMGFSMNIQRNVLNPLGFGILVFGIYMLLVFFDVVPFNSRFDFFGTYRNVLWTSIISIGVGVILLNEKIKNLFH